MYQETTKPLLRPNQIEELNEEKRRIEATLQAPPHIAAAIQSPGDLRRQLQSINRTLESQTPKPYREEEKDASLKREVELREEIRRGMPTHREQRRNPAGNVDKHRAWEQRNKNKILEWKNIRLRQHASEMLDELRDAKDVANFERFRPVESSDELNMHNEQIPGKVQHGPYSMEPSTVFSDEDKSALKAIDPEIADSLALMNNEQRATVKAFLQEVLTPKEQTVQYHEDFEKIKAKAPNDRKWTEEERRIHGEKIRAAKARKREG